MSLSLLSAGSNARGQLATGNLDDAHRFTPCKFTGHATGSLPEHIVGVEKIACGANHTLALLRAKDGRTELWGCGDGSRGQLGPTYISDITEKEDISAVFRPLDLRIRELGVSSPQEYTVRLVAAGWETSYVVLSSPERSDLLLSFGADDFGNLGIGTASSTAKLNPSPRPEHRVHFVHLLRAIPVVDPPTTITTVLSLSTGPHHVLAHIRLREPDGSSVAYFTGWGASRHGQLGPILDPSSARPVPTCPSPVLIPCAAPADVTAAPALGTQHTVYVRASGAVVGLGSNRKRQLDRLDALADVVQVGCTWNGTYALLLDGRVVATGSDTHSQLGRGPPTQTVLGAGANADSESAGFQPVAFVFRRETHRVVKLVCGSEHVLCLVDVTDPGGEERSKESEVWGWGWNEHGNLGTGGTTDANVPVRIWPPSRRGPEDGVTRSQEDEVGGRRRHDDVVDIWAGCGTSWILIRT